MTGRTPPQEAAIDTERFYAELPAFSDFTGIVDPANYRAAPDDWTVLMTDVQRSTQAIQAGQFKEVNLLTTAAIVCVQRVLGEREFPFVFGGDGATALVPRPYRDHGLTALLSLEALAKNHYGLWLRVGAVDVADLRAEGHDIRVARHALSPTRAIAILDGSGLQEASRRIRADPIGHQYGVEAESDADLSGLSCRWQPVPTQRGVIVSLILQARNAERDIYREVLDRFDAVLENGLEAANPVGADWMRYRSVSECIADERPLHRGGYLAWLARLLEIWLAVGIFRYGLPGMFFRAARYTRELRTHSDYRKYDTTLHMTLDCSPAEASAIRAICQDAHRQGRIYYGISEADSALMTCFLNGLGDGQHIHFVDAVDGGYTLAAARMKDQMAEAAAPDNP